MKTRKAGPASPTRNMRGGFTLVEVLIAIAIVGFVLAAASTFFVLSVRQYVVQSKIVETNVEGVLGLELLRKDLEGLGFGLPWNNLPSYAERSAGIPSELSALNDANGVAPRAVACIDNAPSNISMNRSDYLVVKSASVGMSAVAGKWTTLTQAGEIRNWSPNEENPSASDQVIVIALGSTETDRRSLVNPGTYYLQFNGLAAATGYRPVEPYSANLVYGIDNSASLARPFNRADYFIAHTSSTSYSSDFLFTVPERCAPNTGVLVKAVVPHNGNGTPTTLLPLLDCVADMQVVFNLDNVWTLPAGLSGLTAAQLRARLREVRVSILTHEGGLDKSYTHSVNPVYVGMTDAGGGRDFPLSGDYIHYRWRVYNLVIRPWNLSQ